MIYLAKAIEGDSEPGPSFFAPMNEGGVFRANRLILWIFGISCYIIETSNKR